MLSRNMRKLIVTLLALALIIVVGCSKDSDNSTGPNDADAYIWVHHNNDSTQVYFDDLAVFDITTLGKSNAENDAIWLHAFVDTNLIPMSIDRDEVAHDARNLYAYRLEGDDGFSPAVNRGYPDNVWEHMSLGYIMTDIRRVIFPDELIDLPGAFNVSDIRHIKVLRKVDCESPDSTGFTLMMNVQSQQVENDDGVMEDAIPLQDLVTSFILTPANHTYTLEAIDGYTPPTDLTWEEFQTGYWLLDSEKTWFTDVAYQTGQYKVRELLKIMVN